MPFISDSTAERVLGLKLRFARASLRLKRKRVRGYSAGAAKSALAKEITIMP
ncbi:hypothetical protein [Desulfosporosinus sp. SB140]|uniref:hypothetical protein n=1 Tax=Desulfosporosinus paludis TaxID=3115649 RepID=UPI00388D2A8B